VNCGAIFSNVIAQRQQLIYVRDFADGNDSGEWDARLAAEIRGLAAMSFYEILFKYPRQPRELVARGN
jgi:hypothetical protein